MSDIPSALSKWEPPRWLKVAFLVTVVLSVAALFGAKLFQRWVVEPRLIEESDPCAHRPPFARVRRQAPPARPGAAPSLGGSQACC